MNVLELGPQLGFNDFFEGVRLQKPLALSEEAKATILHSRQYLDRKLDGNTQAFYGINTGFGSLCNTVISPENLEQLQENLILSHACGTGRPVPVNIVKIMLALKVQNMSYGISAVHPDTVNRLMDFYNLDIIPVVYENGSLGASGDLAPLAHLSLPLLGQGKVWVKNSSGNYEMKEAAPVLAKHGLKPLKLKAKEGLALINGTQFMTAYAVHILNEAANLTAWANVIASASLDAFHGRPEPFSELINKARGHAGQDYVAKQIRHILKDSAILMEEKTAVQDPYCFRCIPQVHGASLDAIGYTRMTIMTEIVSVTDNPMIFVEEDKILSGGNFHGQPIALALDFLAIALAEYGSISERRTYQLISGLRGLPPFLTANPGLNSGFMIPQYTAASMVSLNKQLATPASVDSIVSSNGQEDHVSMGANAALKTHQITENVWRVLAIEWMTAMQALEFRRPSKSSSLIEELYNEYREIVPKLEDDRLLHTDIENTLEFIRNKRLTSQ